MEITQLEQDSGFLALDKKTLPKETDLDSFVKHAINNQHEYIGFNYKDRTKFLEDNGYKLTRENYINADLPTKPKAKNKR